MRYKNAKKVLPENLLRLIQEYIQGEFIYIPMKEENKTGWGEKNGTRELMATRNKAIFDMYNNGYTVNDLTDKYNLSESSIRKILSRIRREEKNNSGLLGGCSYE